jgi:uncharacterized protein YdhG (YjbR/CyaY superfamily)
MHHLHKSQTSDAYRRGQRCDAVHVAGSMVKTNQPPAPKAKPPAPKAKPPAPKARPLAPKAMPPASKRKPPASKAKPPASKAKAANPAAVDAWLAKLPSDQRGALQRLREQIRAAAPGTVETIAYGVPMYYLGTSPLFGFSAFKHHVSLGVGSATFDAIQDALAGYDTAKGTIRFTPDRPLPAALVKRIVRARLDQHAADQAK